MKDTALLAIQVLPQGVDDPYGVIDQAIDVIKQSGLTHQVCPLETVVEGPVDQLFALAQRVHQRCVELGASSVLTNIKLHQAAGGSTIADKLANHPTP